MMCRRSMLLGSAIGIPFLLNASKRASGQSSKFDTFNLFVPAGPGGGWDGVARAVEQVARDAGLVGSFGIENVPGAGGTVGLPRFINQHRGRPNSLLIAGNVMIGAVITNKTPYGLKDVVPIARLTQEAGVIAVGANSPYKNLADLANALKANPSLPVGGGSAGGIDHITLGLLLKSLGADTGKANYVAFANKAQVLPAIIDTQVHAAISGYSEFAEQIKAGQVRALATTGDRPLPGAGVPTLKESGIDVVLASWRGVFAPPDLAADQIKALEDLIATVYGLPTWRQILETRQWDDAYVTGEAFKAVIEKDTESIGLALKAIGLA